MINDDIDAIIQRGEERMVELNSKYEGSDLDDLNNFKSDATVQEEGEEKKVSSSSRPRNAPNYARRLSSSATSNTHTNRKCKAPHSALTYASNPPLPIHFYPPKLEMELFACGAVWKGVWVRRWL